MAEQQKSLPDEVSSSESLIPIKVIRKPTQGKRKKHSEGPKCYRAKWEQDDLLKAWISPHPTDFGKVVCRYCNSLIRAHKTDLIEHSKTRKHVSNFHEKSSPEEFAKFVKLQEANNNKISLNTLTSTTTNGSKPKQISETPTSQLPQLRKPSSSASTILFPIPVNIPHSSPGGVAISRPNELSLSTASTIQRASTSSTTTTSHSPSNVPSFSLTFITPQSQLSPSTTTVTFTSDCDPSAVASSVSSSNHHYLDKTTVSSNNLSAGEVDPNPTVTTLTPPDIDLQKMEVTLLSSTRDQLEEAFSEDIWHDTDELTNHGSPSTLVSVILEEQLSPPPETGTCTTNSGLSISNSSSTLRESSSALPDGEMLIHQINLLNSTNSSTRHQQLQHPISIAGIITSSTNSSSSSPNLTGAFGGNISSQNHQSIAVSDILETLRKGKLTISELSNIAKEALHQIDICVDSSSLGSYNRLHNPVVTSDNVATVNTHSLVPITFTEMLAGENKAESDQEPKRKRLSVTAEQNAHS